MSLSFSLNVRLQVKQKHCVLIWLKAAQLMLWPQRTWTHWHLEGLFYFVNSMQREIGETQSVEILFSCIYILIVDLDYLWNLYSKSKANIISNVVSTFL